MQTPELDRLSQISTNWHALFASHPSSDSASQAHRNLVLRYYGAVYHYLLTATRDVHAADDLAQEFALRFVRGDFHRADPNQGRFRDYIKTILRHLVADHFRVRKRSPHSLLNEESIPSDDSHDESSNAVFVRFWRQEILNRTWQELQNSEGVGLFDALRWKASTPQGTASEGARELTERTHREVTPSGFRQSLHRAREKFAELLLAEVARSLGTSDPVEVQQELAELKLIEFCRPALNREPSSGS